MSTLASSSGASIEFRGIAKRYGSTVALSDLDLAIQPGEFVALLGPSGSGKTTTLNILAGLLAPDSGQVFIGDRDVTRLQPDRRDIAMVFQNYALYPHMTVAENLAFPLHARGRGLDASTISRKVREVAELLAIAPLLQRYPKEISGGQQQRVALGRAMVRDPKVFLLDEPLSNLDSRLRLRMRHDLKTLHLRLKSTIVYVTHDQSEAMSLADRIAIYRAGELQQVAPPVEIYRRPVNLFVANFMGDREMNICAGRIETAGDRVLFLAEELSIELGDRGSTWARFAGRTVTLGIRAEAVQLGRLPDAAYVDATLRLIEHDGAQQVFYAQAGALELCGRAPADAQLAIGEPVALSLLRSEIYLFDGQSGTAIVQAAVPVAGLQ